MSNFTICFIDVQQEEPMPMNNVKVYGEEVGNNPISGTENEVIERLWRNIFAGSASTRFQRLGTMSPEAGGWEKEETIKLDWSKGVLSWWGPDRVLVLNSEDFDSYVVNIEAK